MARLPGIDVPEQVVCHVDMDCFYAACERLRQPALEGEPLVVGMGYDADETHGAVATASYEAREYGVESAMAISDALEVLPRRDESDPALDGEHGHGLDSPADSASDSGSVSDAPPATGIYRPVDMPFYESVSEEVREVLETKADTIRIVSIDEAYLDLEDLDWSEAVAFGRSLKQQIESRTGVVASVGIAPDMTTAKLASDADKPDGLVVVEPGNVREFLTPISVEDLHGVGPVTASELRQMGYETAGDIASANASVFVEAFGERGQDIYAQARGEDDRAVEPKGKPKSVSSESAFAEATDEIEPKARTIRSLAHEAAERATAKDALYRTIGIKVVTPPFEVHTRSRSLSGPVDDPALVERIADGLLSEFEADPVRKLGVRLSNLSFDDREQTAITEWDTVETESQRQRRVLGKDRSIRKQTRLSRFDR